MIKVDIIIFLFYNYPMGLFTPTKPIITAKEAKEIENRLYSEHGFNQKKISMVRELLKPHLNDAEQYGDPVGISPKEVQEINEQLETKDPHQIYSVKLNEPEIAAVEKLLEDYKKLNR